MPRSPRRIGAVVSVIAVVAVAVGVAATYGPLRPQSDPPGGRGGPPVDEGLAEEAEEQKEKTEKRNEAFEKARRAGTSGQNRPVNAAAAPGWAGEFPMDTTWDDWEPAIAADPNGPFVYALVTRYGAPKPCSGNCPTPWIALEISADNGATWSAGKPLCACKGSGQFDPIIEVVPSNGHVYALYMNGFNVLFTKSTNRGATWSAPVPTWGNVSWNDKPVLTMSDDGKDVYISWNGPTSGDPYIVQSHDFGTTWTQLKFVDSGRYFYAYDADVAPDGTVYFSESSISYGNSGKTGAVVGTIEHHVFVSTDKGASWQDRIAATVQAGAPCDADGCTPDFYTGHTSLSVDANGAIVLVYDGAVTSGGLQRISAVRSTNRGATWSAPVVLSVASENATAPAVESRGNGDVRAIYYQTSGGGNDDAWNIWYRRSSDGGATWTAAVKISDAPGGAAYKAPAGFLEVYGDYAEIAITNTGKTIAIWGEGLSYTGPGGAWINREP